VFEVALLCFAVLSGEEKMDRKWDVSGGLYPFLFAAEDTTDHCSAPSRLTWTGRVGAGCVGRSTERTATYVSELEARCSCVL